MKIVRLLLSLVVFLQAVIALSTAKSPRLRRPTRTVAGSRSPPNTTVAK
jgi:hypothetical protein